MRGVAVSDTPSAFIPYNLQYIYRYKEERRKFRISNLESRIRFELNIELVNAYTLIRAYTRWAGEEGRNSCWTAEQLDRYSFPGRASRVERVASWSKDNCTLRYGRGRGSSISKGKDGQLSIYRTMNCRNEMENRWFRSNEIQSPLPSSKMLNAKQSGWNRAFAGIYGTEYVQILQYLRYFETISGVYKFVRICTSMRRCIGQANTFVIGNLEGWIVFRRVLTKVRKRCVFQYVYTACIESVKKKKNLAQMWFIPLIAISLPREAQRTVELRNLSRDTVTQTGEMQSAGVPRDRCVDAESARACKFRKTQFMLVQANVNCKHLLFSFKSPCPLVLFLGTSRTRTQSRPSIFYPYIYI